MKKLWLVPVVSLLTVLSSCSLRLAGCYVHVFRDGTRITECR